MKRVKEIQEFGHSDATHYRCRAYTLTREHNRQLINLLAMPLWLLIGIQAGIALCFIIL